MFKFNKKMAGVIKDESLESQGCGSGCGPKKSQASAGASCCGPAKSSNDMANGLTDFQSGASCCGPVKSSCGESNLGKKQITKCTPCSAPVKTPCCGNSSEKS